MTVCICRGVSDTTVRKTIDEGACSLAGLRACGIGDQCGSCHRMLRKLLAVAAAERAAVADAHPAATSAPAVALSSAP
jgi:bacterioferritin-associated ferredoxin